MAIKLKLKWLNVSNLWLALEVVVLTVEAVEQTEEAMLVEWAWAAVVEDLVALLVVVEDKAIGVVLIPDVIIIIFLGERTVIAVKHPSQMELEVAQ